MRPPRHFDVSIGGYFGPSYRVHLEGNGRLLHETFTIERECLRRGVDVQADAWQRFADAIEAAGAVSWARVYRPPSVICDGTSWILELEHHGRIIKSGGKNAYPDGDHPGPQFNAFLHAVEALVGFEFR
jgi:hypothetical protein